MAGYKIYRDGILVTSHQSPVTSYSDTGLQPSTTYSYTVSAYDAAVNESGKSPAASATTLALPDTTLPTVSIASPANGSTVSDTITVSAAASDNVGVVGAQFQLDGANLGAEDTTSPYEITLDTATLTNGAHTLSAIARDSAGNSATSNIVNITVNNIPSDTKPPTITITAPTSGITIAGTITVSATALDNTSVTGVQFKLDGVNFGTEQVRSSLPYSYTYSISWNTSAVANGEHAITAMAHDSTGNETTSASVTVTVLNNDGDTQKRLLQQTDLKYIGAFRLPPGKFGSAQYNGFGYGGTALAYNPANNSLFIVGHDWEQKVAEIKIPEIINSNTLSDLKTATVLQNFADPTDGKKNSVDGNDPEARKIGGLLPYNNLLYGSVYVYYDGDGDQKTSHFISSLDISKTDDAQGMYKVGEIRPGFVSNYMTLVPEEWQFSLGGPAITGGCCISIISRTSYGPAAFAFDPNDLGKQDPAPALPLVYYPSSHPNLGEWGSTNPYFNGSTEVTGIVFPEGTRSALFFGRHGIGEFCYGEGGGKPPQGAVHWCYDPVNGDKGNHAYPYIYQIWAYDVLDFSAVKDGQKQPWEIKPYAVWTFDLPFAREDKRIGGAAYDPKTRRIYVSQQYGDKVGLEPLPVIHVFEVIANTSDTIQPSVPTNLTATAISSTQINLSWSASTDNPSAGSGQVVGVAGYKIYRDGSLLSTINYPLSTYSDTGLQPSTTYNYTVSAYDTADNESPKSSLVSATTLAQFKQSDLNQDGKTDEQDFNILKQDYNRTDKPLSDLNQDGIVDSRDLGILMSEWDSS